MLSPTAAWQTAVLKSGSRVGFLLEITNGVSTWYVVDRSCSQLGYPAHILGVSGIAAELDPLERTPGASSVTVTVTDAWARPLIVNNRIKGMKATLKMGSADNAAGDFLTIFIGPIESYSPRDGHSVDIEIVDVFTLLERADIKGAWINKHPLEVIEDICTRAGIAAAYLDTASLDPSDAANTSIGHYVTSRGSLTSYSLPDDSVTNPTDALTLVGEIARLMNGYFVAKESGQLVFQRFDSAAAADGAWTSREIIPGSFKQLSVDDNVINRIAIKFKLESTGAFSQASYVANDTASQSAYAYPGTTERVLSYEFETKWKNSECWITGDGATAVTVVEGISAVDTSMRLAGPTECMTGTRGMVPGPQPGEADLSADQPAWLMIRDVDSEVVEIVKSTSITNQFTREVFVPDPDTGTTTKYTLPWMIVYSNLSRGQLGTTAAAHAAYSHVYDITPLVDLGDSLLGRFRTGCPLIELRTHLSEMKYQLGDIVTVTTDDFLAYGEDGLSGSEKFEIVCKELDPYGSPPSIRWVLAYAGTAAITRTGEGWSTNSVDSGIRASASRSSYHAIDTAVATGLAVASTAGLVGSTSAGFAVEYPYSASLRAAVSHTYTASKDTYVAFDCVSGALTYYEVALGASQPLKSYTEVWLAKVVTGPVAISSVTDLRTYTSIDGAAVSNATLDAAAIVDNSITATQLAPSAVGSSELASSAVTAAAVASGAIQAVAIATTAYMGETLNLNGNFTART